MTQLQLSEEPPKRPDAPLLYVACALSHVDDTEKMLLEAWCEVIKRAVSEVTAGAEQKWVVRTYMPIEWSAPGSPHSSAEIYEQNARIVQGAAGLIVVGYRGGSLGAGQEFAWATGLRLPILYLRPKDHPVSRQVEGTPADLAIEEFVASSLYDIVAGFIRKQRPIIEDHARQLRDRALMLTPFKEPMEVAWGALSTDEQEKIAGNARLHVRRIERLVSDPLTLASASMNEVVALAGALGVNPWRNLSGQMPELSSSQRAALRTASQEYEWDGAETLGLYEEARMELARGGVRRLPFATVEDWVQFRASLNSD